MPNITKPSDPNYRSDVAECKHEMEEGCGEYAAMYRGYYRAEYGSETLLSDNQIYLMVANADDDDDPAGWAQAMYDLERELTLPEKV